MMNWLFVVVIVLFVGSIFSGYKKGLFKTLFSILAIIIAVAITTFISPYIAAQVNNNVAVTQKVRKQVVGIIDLASKNQNDEEQEKFIENMPVPKYAKDYLKRNNNLQVYQERKINSFNEYVVDGLVRMVINLITFVVLYLIIRIGLVVVSIMGNIITNLPIIEQFDGMGGTLLGAVQGIMEIWILFLIIAFMSNTDIGISAMQCIETNGILETLYNNNIIMEIMYQFIR